MSLNNKPLCYAPFKNLGTFYKEDGIYKYTVCCNREIEALENVTDWNDKLLCEIRKGLTGDSEMSPACKECLSFGDLSTARLYDVSDTLDTLRFDPETGECKSEDLKACTFIGGKCNLACRMCNGQVSSTFSKVHPKYAEPINEISNYKLDIPVDSILSQVAGGEPLLIKRTAELVEDAVERDITSFIVSHGAVNIEKNKIYDVIKKHHEHVYFLISLDADWDTHEWIRVGIDIELLKKNIKQLHEDKVLGGFNIVVSTMNWNKFLFPIQLAEELGIYVDITFLNIPTVMSCKHIRQEDRRKYAEELLLWVRENGISEKNKESVTDAIKSLLSLPFIGDDNINDEQYIYMTREIN